MKPEFDREIDALLRGRARRADVRAGDGADAPSRRAAGGGARDGRLNERDAARAQHLDADELSSFAEHALPDAALARYAAHLADCDDCRRAATTLALAANVAVAREEGEVSASREAVSGRGAAASKVSAATWRGRVAAWLAPGAWRYAMPVVALLCAGVVALVVMRSVPREKLGMANGGGARQIAETNEQARAANHAEGAGQPSASDAVQNQGNSGFVNPEAGATNNTGTTSAPGAASNENARREVAANRQLDKVESESQVGGAVAGSPSVSPAVAQQRADEPSPKSVAANAPASPSAAMPMVMPATPTPSPVPLPPASNADEIALKDARTESKNETAREESQTKTRRAARKGEAAGGGAGRAALSAGAAPAAPPEANAAGASAKRSQPSNGSDDAKSKGDRERTSSETRAAGGRRFRKDGGAWVDAAYGGQATTVVRRGSEQYRALVADEPEIGRIADALGGEVVVVWKGRAYRIKQ
ncbi:MAG: zf-HC2 domain-containing protein [Acidobacteria bacterium]|nr:zf-HC2 domain-containing protein [Acidobacteriota bacterium]